MNTKYQQRVSNNLKQYSPFVLQSVSGCTIFWKKNDYHLSKLKLYRSIKKLSMYLRHAGRDPASRNLAAKISG